MKTSTPFIKRSVIAAVLVAALGVISIGALGGALYVAAFPVLGPFHGRLDDWQGDWVWPATIYAGSLWALSFIAAGWINRHLVQRDAGPRLRWAVYVAVLWLGAVVTWALILGLMPSG